jgi:hypothetical protein
MKKDKRQKTGGMLKGLIKTGGDVMDKAMDKGGDLAAAMMDQTAALISKLSDDVGSMADRILTMEERIGLMADRIVRTEELMAKLTATLANKELELPAGGSTGEGPFHPPLLSLGSTGVSRASPPDLQISGDPSVFLLHVSSTSRFAEGSTVISKVATPEELGLAWYRSLSAIIEPSGNATKKGAEPVSVSVAVKTVGPDQRVSPLSNSVDLTIHD